MVSSQLSKENSTFLNPDPNNFSQSTVRLTRLNVIDWH
jgi:hypothetical protein